MKKKQKKKKTSKTLNPLFPQVNYKISKSENIISPSEYSF